MLICAVAFLWIFGNPRPNGDWPRRVPLDSTTRLSCYFANYVSTPVDQSTKNVDEILGNGMIRKVQREVELTLKILERGVGLLLTFVAQPNWFGASKTIKLQQHPKHQSSQHLPVLSSKCPWPHLTISSSLFVLAISFFPRNRASSDLTLPWQQTLSSYFQPPFRTFQNTWHWRYSFSALPVHFPRSGRVRHRASRSKQRAVPNRTEESEEVRCFAKWFDRLQTSYFGFLRIADTHTHSRIAKHSSQLCLDRSMLAVCAKAYYHYLDLDRLQCFMRMQFFARMVSLNQCTFANVAIPGPDTVQFQIIHIW